MNVHHLELFYYVAQHQGITAAVRAMPYGIQQPAISSQLRQLEYDLGVNLFHRRPFRLTPAGEELFAFAQPFFARLEEVAHQVGQSGQRLRIAAAEIVLRDYLPNPLQDFQDHSPEVTLALRSGTTEQMLQWLVNQSVDVVLAPLTKQLPAGVESHPLIAIPLALIVPQAITAQSAMQLIRKRAGKDALIALPEEEPVTRLFLDELNRRQIQWPVALELTGLDMIRSYVERGFGIGVGVSGLVTHEPTTTRVLPLRRFPKLEIAAYHLGRPHQATDALMSALRTGARALSNTIDSPNGRTGRNRKLPK